MWDPNLLDKLAREFYDSEEEHASEQVSIKDELKTPTRYGQKEVWSEGGMKQIYQIYDHTTCRNLAMAELKTDLIKDYTEHFLREARLTATLDHPNIVSIHEIGLHDDGSPFFTMDFLSNRTLEQLIQEHQLKVKEQDPQQLLFERLEVFLKVCDAISYAHSRGVVHLDIKLSNIHVGLYGEVWVCDWGLGKSLDEPEIEMKSIEPVQKVDKELLEIWTSHGVAKGTPGSMAPEQIRGYKYADKSSDVYSLGCLLFELVCLEKPFEGGVDVILSKTLEGDLREPSFKYVQSIPRSIKAVISKAMSLDSSDRYVKVNELHKEIELYMGGHATKAESAGLFVELKLFLWRYKFATVTAFFLLGVISLMTLLFVIKLQESTIQAQRSAKIAKEQAEKVKVMMLELDKERNLAEGHMKRAEYVAKQYEREKSLFEDHRKATVSAAESYNKILLSDLIFDDPVKSVKLSIQQLKNIPDDSPHYQWALDRLIYTYFIKQDYEKVIESYGLLEESGRISTYKDLYEVSNLFMGKLEKNGLLSLGNLVKMLDKLKEVKTMLRTHLVEKLIGYDFSVRKEGDYLEPVAAVLRHWNEEWNGEGLRYFKKNKTLEISSPDLRMFKYVKSISSDRCIFRFLDFDHLILSHSGVYDLSHFTKMRSMYSIDLRDTNIHTLGQLNEFEHLTSIKINKNQFSKNELRGIPNNVEVVMYEN